MPEFSAYAESTFSSGYNWLGSTPFAVQPRAVFFFLRQMQKKSTAKTKRRKAMPAATPIPAFAPVDSADLLVAERDAALRVGTMDVVVVEVPLGDALVVVKLVKVTTGPCPVIVAEFESRVVVPSRPVMITSVFVEDGLDDGFEDIVG